MEWKQDNNNNNGKKDEQRHIYAAVPLCFDIRRTKLSFGDCLEIRSFPNLTIPCLLHTVPSSAALVLD